MSVVYLFLFISDPFRGDFDLEKHLPDELDLLPSTSTWPNLDPPSAPPPPNMLLANAQNQLNQQAPKFQMNGEASAQPPSLMQVWILTIFTPWL